MAAGDDAADYIKSQSSSSASSATYMTLRGEICCTCRLQLTGTGASDRSLSVHKIRAQKWQIWYDQDGCTSAPCEALRMFRDPGLLACYIHV